MLLFRGFFWGWDALYNKLDANLSGRSRLTVLLFWLILTLVGGTACLIAGAHFTWPLVSALGYLVLVLGVSFLLTQHFAEK